MRDGVWDAALGTDAGNNLDADPRFVVAVAGLDAPTSSGDLRLMQASPAINAGSNAALPEDTSDLDGDGNTTERLALDLAGNPRVIDTSVDMGAYEVVPHVLAIRRADASPSNAASVSFSVQFTMALSGVTAQAFALEATGGQAGATISAVSGSGTDWSVSVATVADAVGTIGLNLVDDDTLLSNDDPPAALGGSGAGNGDFTGEVYRLDRAAPTTMLTSGPSGTTNSPTASFTFTGDDGNGAGGVGFACALDAAGFTPCSSPLELSNLGLGRHSLRVRAVDALGNLGLPASRNWSVTESASAPEMQLVFMPLVQR